MPPTIEKTTLGLNLPTDPRWVDVAKMSISEILIDHAWCEQKAASTGISLIIKFFDHEKLVDNLTVLVAEEWSHFRMVLREMEKRSIKLTPNRIDVYVTELMKLERKGGHINTQLLDRLLINALIEARSAEKFKLLSTHISDVSLKQFYHDLMITEAGHYRNYLDLAKEYMPENVVETRWSEMLAAEAEILTRIGVIEGKFH
ncbi:MAG: tRNA-(ms[2]io[6]A)-hydroxylase [Cytophagales bacterium]